jgi:glycosyltransferase involved in cell wall biosynthesis
MTSVPLNGELEAPRIDPVTAGVERPHWSVMIPTFNCAVFLRRALESILAQDPGQQQMQIEVIDDCSTLDDPYTVVQEFGQGRIGFYRKTRNEGAVRNFNTCIQRSLGLYVHILHGDDWVAPGYYSTIAELSAHYPELGLYATRSFFVDEDSIITSVSERIPTLEQPARSAKPFYYDCPLEFAGITVRRATYEALGGFRPALLHTADRDMWARIVAAHGAIMSPQVMGFYRMFAANHTSQLVRTGENIRDMCRLNKIFSHSYPEFSEPRARSLAADLAWHQCRKFELAGDHAAAEENRRVWRELSSAQQQTAKLFATRIKPTLRKLVFGGKM